MSRGEESEITLGWRLVRELEPQMCVDFFVVPADAGRCFFYALLADLAVKPGQVHYDCIYIVFIRFMHTL